MNTQATPWISLDIIKQFLPDNPVIIEAGAHQGKDTKKFKLTWPESTVHCFEPVPYLFEMVKHNTAHLSNIFYYPYALGDRDGLKTMYISSGKTDACSSLLEPKEIIQERPDISFDSTIQAQTITLDSWSAQYNIPNIDFMWLDTQGFELPILQYAITLLPRVHAIHAEISQTERYQDNTKISTLVDFLAHFGFTPYIQALNTYGWGNMLFIRPL